MTTSRYSVHVIGTDGGVFLVNNLTPGNAVAFAESLYGNVLCVYVTQGDVIVPFADLHAAASRRK